MPLSVVIEFVIFDLGTFFLFVMNFHFVENFGIIGGAKN
jgi:NADH:ubiquinone oxidoreductase subunit 3 (subunit A)